MFGRLLILFSVGIFIFGITKLSFAMMCAQAESGEHKHMESEATSATAKEAVNVGNKICPVSGEKINEKTKATYEYEGKIYNFCCPMCIEDFKKDPEKYIKKTEEEKQKETVTEKVESASEMHQHHEHQHMHR